LTAPVSVSGRRGPGRRTSGALRRGGESHRPAPRWSSSGLRTTPDMVTIEPFRSHWSGQTWPGRR